MNVKHKTFRKILINKDYNKFIEKKQGENND